MLHLLVLLDHRFPDKSLANVSRLALSFFVNLIDFFRYGDQWVAQLIDDARLRNVSHEITQMVLHIAAAKIKDHQDWQMVLLPEGDFQMVMHNTAIWHALEDMLETQKYWGTGWNNMLGMSEQVTVFPFGAAAVENYMAQKAALEAMLGRPAAPIGILHRRGGFGLTVGGPPVQFVNPQQLVDPQQHVNPRQLTIAVGGEAGEEGQDAQEGEAAEKAEEGEEAQEGEAMDEGEAEEEGEE